MIESLWLPERALLITRLQGAVTEADVQEWIASLNEAFTQIEPDTLFRVIEDFDGYDPAEMSAHKAMRTVMPLTLARCGFRTALFDLYDPIDVPITSEAGRRCVALAHVHHDAGKMGEYDRRLGRANERFFTHFAAAEQWITTLII